MQIIEPKTLWRIVPVIVMGFASNMSFARDPSLYLIAGTFLAMKALEFSARRMLDEMVYVPLDYDAVSLGLDGYEVNVCRVHISHQYIYSIVLVPSVRSATLGRRSSASSDIASARAAHRWPFRR